MYLCVCIDPSQLRLVKIPKTCAQLFHTVALISLHPFSMKKSEGCQKLITISRDSRGV